MEIAATLLEVSGLLAVVSSLALVFSQLMGWLLGRSRNAVRSSVLILLALSVAYIALEPALRLLGWQEVLPFLERAMALVWWLGLGLVLDTAIRRVVWQQLLAEHGVSHVPKLIRDLVSLLIYAAAVMVIMHFVYDEPIGAVLATSGGLAFVLGFAAQKTIGEAFAGLSLSLSRTLKVGDYLEVNGIYGCVHEMNWRSVSLHNPHTDSLYIFPNSVMASSTVLNYNTPTDRFKNWVKFVVEPHASPDLVMRAVMDELRNSRFVYQNPKPDINMLGFTELGVEYRIRYYFEGDDPWWDAQNEVVNAIWNAMRRHGFHFGVNRMKLATGLEWDTPIEPVFRQHTEELVSLMQGVSAFAMLEQEELQALAIAAELRELTPPESLFEQGDRVKEVFLLQSGEVSHHMTDAGVCHRVAINQPGELFWAGSSAARTTAQPISFSRVWGLSLDQLNRSEAGRRVVEQLQVDENKMSEALSNEFARQSHLHASRLHTAGHQRLRHLLKRSYVHYLRSGLIGKVMTTLRPAVAEAQLLEALTSAGALVVVAGDAANREGERALFEELSLHINELHHISHETIMQRYDAAVVDTESDFEQAYTRAMGLLEEYADNEHEALLLLAGVRMLAGESGIPTERQSSLLQQIADKLGSVVAHEEVLAQLEAKLK